LQVKYLNVLPWSTVMCLLPVLVCKHCGNRLTDSTFVLLFVTIEIRFKEKDSLYFANKQLWSNGQWVFAFIIHLSQIMINEILLDLLQNSEVMTRYIHLFYRLKI
jgi:hypothetical protein